MLITENVESINMYKEGGGKRKTLIIKSPRGNHCHKLCGSSHLGDYAFLTYMRNYRLCNFAEDTFFC